MPVQFPEMHLEVISRDGEEKSGLVGLVWRIGAVPQGEPVLGNPCVAISTTSK